MLDALAFILPCLLFLEVRLVGRLFAPEILILGLLPMMLIYKGRLLTAPMPRMVLSLGVAWLMVQVGTDLYRETVFADYSRGWSKIIFTLLNFSFLYMLLYNNRKRLLLFAMGMVVGGYLVYFFNPTEYAQGDPWKFGYGGAITLFLVLCAQWGYAKNLPRIVSLILFFAAGLNLINGYRSLAGICFVTAMFLFVQGRQTRPGAKFSRKRLVMIVVIGAIGSYGFLEFYGYAASGGLLGSKAQEKYEFQSSGKFGVVLGGRKEFLVAVQAIADAPIIGHGSWAKDDKYLFMLLEMMGVGAMERAMISARNPKSGLIPTHSFIFGAWVEAGIIGPLFWAYFLWLIGRNLIFLSQMKETLSPLIIFISFQTLWDVIFSPYGGDRRLLVPYFIVLAIYCWERVLEHRRRQGLSPR